MKLQINVTLNDYLSFLKTLRALYAQHTSIHAQQLVVNSNVFSDSRRDRQASGDPETGPQPFVRFRKRSEIFRNPRLVLEHPDRKCPREAELLDQVDFHREAERPPRNESG